MYDHGSIWRDNWLLPSWVVGSAMICFELSLFASPECDPTTPHSKFLQISDGGLLDCRLLPGGFYKNSQCAKSSLSGPHHCPMLDTAILYRRHDTRDR